MDQTTGGPSGPEPPWQEFADLLVRGEVIPFLGAAASSYSGQQAGSAPPTVENLVEKLAKKASLNDFKCQKGCGQSRFDLARVASYYRTIAPRHRLDEFLTAEIANPAFAPNPLHHLIARIAREKPMLVITTNYDDLLEKAFDNPADRKGPVPYEVVVTPAGELARASDFTDASKEDGGTGPEHAGGVLHWISESGDADFKRVDGSHLLFDLTKRSIIYKIHGSVPRGSLGAGYLITEEDYTYFLGRMERRDLVPDPIKNLIAKKKTHTIPVYSLLFLGYGMRDWNLRVLLEELLKVGRRPRSDEAHYALMRRPDPVEKKLLEERQVQVFDGDLASFVQNVSQLSQLPS